MALNTLEWVDWFNHRRLLEPIGNTPPAEAEARYYAALDQMPLAAKLESIGLQKARGGSLLPGLWRCSGSRDVHQPVPQKAADEDELGRLLPWLLPQTR